MQPTGALLLALGFAFGGLSFALYPLSVAHANDRLLPSERVTASGQLVLLYSAGAALGPLGAAAAMTRRSEEHTSELQSLMRISYAVFCLKKNNRPLYLLFRFSSSISY